MEHIQGTDEVTLLASPTQVQISSFHQNLNEEAGPCTPPRRLVVPGRAVAYGCVWWRWHSSQRVENGDVC